MEQHPQRSLKSLRRSSEATGEISLYSGLLTPAAVIDNVATIKKAFPGLPAGFYDVFADRIKENGFCDERLHDAVADVIDNCVYPIPTIANFISYDRTVKFKTHDQMCKEDLWSSHQAVKLPDLPKVIWIHSNDIAAHKLEKYLVNKSKIEENGNEVKTD